MIRSFAVASLLIGTRKRLSAPKDGRSLAIAGVLFFVSACASAAEEKAYGSKTTYNYEVRRLTGEVYRCTAAKP
jgi:hypothetical protein